MLNYNFSLELVLSLQLYFTYLSIGYAYLSIVKVCRFENRAAEISYSIDRDYSSSCPRLQNFLFGGRLSLPSLMTEIKSSVTGMKNDLSYQS